MKSKSILFRTLISSLFACFLIVDSASAQLKAENFSFEARTFIRAYGNELPFWQQANQRGKVQRNSSNLVFDIYFKPQFIKKGAFSFEYAADLTASASNNSSLNISQAYLTTTLWGFQLQAGRWFRQQGLNATDISLGSMMISRNASALPGIEFRTDGYNDVPFTQGYFEYSATFGHFFFEEDRVASNAYLHSKTFYLHLDLYQFKGWGGVVHNVQWAGTHPDFGKLPSSLDDFKRVIFAQSASSNSNISTEASNRLGNHLAAYDFAGGWDDKNFSFMLTRLFYIEDSPGLRFRSPWDGQWTGEIKIKTRFPIKALRYDYIYTIRQDAFSNQPGGRQDYYDNGLYGSGWTYNDSVIGNPLITFDPDKDEFLNNVLVAQSFRVDYMLSEKIRVQNSLVYSRNYGTCSNDFVRDDPRACQAEQQGVEIDFIPRDSVRRDSYSLFAGLDYTPPNLNGIILSFGIGYDIQERIRDNFGFSMGIRFFPFKPE